AGSGEDNAAQSQVKVRGGADDGCVIAAEFQQIATETRCHAWRDFATHAGGTSGGDEFDARVIEKYFADGAVTKDEVADVLVLTAVIDRAHQQSMRTEGGKRAHLRGLPHHGITADQGIFGIPRVHSHREVKRGNHADYTDGLPGFHQSVPGTLRRHGLAVEHAGLAEREIADINHFLHYAFSLGNSLSGFHLNKNSQVMLVFSQQLAPALNHVAAARGWNIAPGFEGFIGSRDHLRCLLFGGAL